MNKQEYINFLENLRNDFYNKSNLSAAYKVQSEINKINKQ
tara:strand:+ start:11691 stop:11810 length:120 start_codon:yes stop_codon:yes gene_type:complete